MFKVQKLKKIAAGFQYYPFQPNIVKTFDVGCLIEVDAWTRRERGNQKIQVLWLLSSHASFIIVVANDRKNKQREIERERE